ncbi:MAG: CARDB domain-containing protein [Pseudomonadales bacterium]
MWWTILAALVLSCVAQVSQAAVFNRIGGDGGSKQKAVSCPGGQYAIAIRTYDDGNVISQLRLRCSRVNPATGAWNGSARWTARSPTERIGGTSGLKSSTASCPRNQFLAPVVKGHLGRFFLTEVVSGLKLRCVRYRDVDSAAGTSRRTLGSERRVGASFHGDPQTSAGTGRMHGDSAVSRISVRYGHAIDSLRVTDLMMPWYKPPAQQGLRRPGPGAATPPSGGSTGVSPPAGQPDLLVNMRSALWRYGGTTRYQGRAYRRVPDAFCSGAMSRRRGSTSSTRQITLPAVEFDVVNAGTAPASNTRLEIRFGDAVSNLSVGALAAGARVRQSVARDTVLRCVTSGRVPGGCFECAGSVAYEDPALQVTVDSNNAVSESDETNNQLQR